MLLAVLLLTIGVAAFVYNTASTSSFDIQRDLKTQAVMAEAKQALIAWSVRRDPLSANDPLSARPGELPCPDINPLDGYEDGSCVAGALGRVPWKTLGIPEPKDASGETLWYTVAGLFRKQNDSSAAITSDTQGSITVYLDNASTTLTTAASTATLLTNQAIAVIFAPGAPLGTQDRSSTATMACTAPSGTYARNRCASNYLETWSSINNATINGPFIQPKSSLNAINDRLLVITAADLMPAVEDRVAREMILYLNRYRSATSVYPWAALGDGNSNGDEGILAYNRNRFPCGTALPTSWAGAGISLPNWLTNGCAAVTGWAGVIYYAVAKNRLQNGGSGCTTCTASDLSITNSGSYSATVCSTSFPPTCAPQVLSGGNADLVLMTAGTFTGSPSRSWSTSTWSTISGYFVDDNATVSAENRDNNNDNFYVPTGTSKIRTRMYVAQ